MISHVIGSGSQPPPRRAWSDTETLSGLFPRARSQFLRLPSGLRAQEEALLPSRFPQPLKQETPSSASLRTARHVPVSGRGSSSRGRGGGTVQKVCAAARAARREEGGRGSSPSPGQSAPLPGGPRLSDLCSAPPRPAPSLQRLPGKGRGGRRSERNSPTVRQRVAESRRSPAPPPTTPRPRERRRGSAGEGPNLLGRNRCLHPCVVNMEREHSSLKKEKASPKHGDCYIPFFFLILNTQCSRTSNFFNEIQYFSLFFPRVKSVIENVFRF